MFLPCKEESIVATALSKEQPVPLVYPWVYNPAWKTCANSPGNHSAKCKVWEKLKQLEKDHIKSKTHTHVCLIPNCTDPFMKFIKYPKKSYFITTPSIAHFSKFHTVMEEGVLMSSIKAGKSIHKNNKAQK